LAYSLLIKERQGPERQRSEEPDSSLMNAQTTNLASILTDLNPGQRQGPAGRAGSQTTSEKLFSRLLGQASKSVRDARSHGTTKRETTGADWLKTLRNQLLSTGIPLKDLSLSSKARPALKDLLLAQGLSEGDVQSFVEKLFGTDSGREIKVTQLLAKLSELKELAGRKSRDPVLDVSALPYLETLLRSLGLDAVQARKAMNLARVDGGGLSVKGLVQALKRIISNLPEETKAAGVNQESGGDVKDLLVRIGIVDEAAEMNGPLSLNSFVRMLEDKVAGLVPHGVSEGETESAVNRLLGHVLTESEKQGHLSMAKALCSAKQHAFSVDGSGDDAVSKHLSKGIEEMVARGVWKTAQTKGMKSSLAKGLQEVVSNGRCHADDSGQAGKKTAGLLVKANGQMSMFKKGPLDPSVDQDTRNAPSSAREVAVNRPHMAGAEAKPMARPFPLHVVNQVGRQLAFAVRRGDSQVRVQLKPPDLGSIQLDMVMKDHTLKVAMITEHHAVKELLMSHVQELRQALIDQGVELKSVDINIDYHFGQSMANAQRDLSEAHPWRLNLPSASGALETGPGRVEEMIQPNVSSDTLVDMFA